MTTKQATKAVDIDLPPKTGGAVTVIEEENKAVDNRFYREPQSEATAIIGLIERAARDQAVDVVKMQALLDMRERVVAREAEQAFNAAMRAAQEKMRPIAADLNNPQTRSRYASGVALDRAIRLIYTAEGFALSFNTGDAPAENIVRVICIASHSGGHTRTYHVDMPADGMGAKGAPVMTKTHATGSGLTYGRRYLKLMIFDLAIGDRTDDDGNAAGGAPVITKEQLEAINKLMAETASDFAKFCEAFGIAAVPDLPASEFQRAVGMLQKKKAKGAKK